MSNKNNKQLYEHIMTYVAKEVKKALNESYEDGFGYGCAIYLINKFDGAASNQERHFKTKEAAISYGRKFLKTNPIAKANKVIAHCFTYSLDEEPTMAYDALSDREFKTYNPIDDEWEYVLSNIRENLNFKQVDEIVQYIGEVKPQKEVSLRKLRDVIQQFSSKRQRAYITGHSFDDIAKILYDALGNVNACFKFPYHDFQAKGKLKDIVKEAVAIMPFSKTPMNIEDTTVFYYGNNTVHGRRCFIPFLSSADVYFLDDYKLEDDHSVTFTLIKAPSYHEYIN